MDLDLRDVKFSKRDVEKGIIIPERLTPLLAEDIGIHIGDGSLYKCNRWKSTYEFLYASNIDERNYLNHIIRLKKKLYNLKKYRVRLKKGKELDLIFNSLAIATFFETSLGIPVGSKVYTAIVPVVIRNSKDKGIISSFLRGVVDTDFYFSYKNKKGKPYPVLSGNFASQKLVEDLSDLFRFLDIGHNTRYSFVVPDRRFNKSYIRNNLTVNGYSNMKKFISVVGFNNPKNIERLKNGPTEI